MTDLRELYQEVILDHNKRPRNFRALEHSSHKAEGFNPLCGDRIMVYLTMSDSVIQDVSFQGSGCAISTASASIMTEMLKGRTVEEVESLFESFHTLVTQDGVEPDDALGELAVLAGVRDFPTRVKCATLAWHTLQAALKRQDEPVTTESADE